MLNKQPACRQAGIQSGKLTKWNIENWPLNIEYFYFPLKSGARFSKNEFIPSV